MPKQLDSVKNVNIDVTEAPMHEVRAGPGIDNVDFAQVQAQYTSYNLLGGARRLDVNATVGNLLASSLSGRGFFRDVAAYVPDSQSVSPFLQPTFNASIDLKQPSFLQRASNTASIGAFTHRTINPGVFIDKGYGGQVTFTNEVAIRAPVSLNYRYEINRVEASDVYFCVNFGVCDTLTINTLRSHQSLSPLMLTGFVDRSNVPLGRRKATWRASISRTRRSSRAPTTGTTGPSSTPPCTRAAAGRGTRSRRISEPVGWRRWRAATSPA